MLLLAAAMLFLGALLLLGNGVLEQRRREVPSPQTARPSFTRTRQGVRDTVPA